MKKSVLIILFSLIVIPSVMAVQPIFYYMEDVDDFYSLVLGENSPAGDTLAALDIALGLQTHNGFDIETVLETEIGEGVQKILIGNPCENKYLENILGLSCEEWPYDEGQAIIKTVGNTLIVTGTTVDDRRRAAKILADYPNYEELKEYYFVLVTGTTLETLGLEIDKAKLEHEFECGDGICEPGEKIFCYADCKQKSCFDVCKDEGFTEAFCRDTPSNPYVPICLDGEINKGMKYCAEQRSCCCKAEVDEEIAIPQAESEEIPLKEDTALQQIPAKTWVIISTIVLVIILVIGFVFIRR